MKKHILLIENDENKLDFFSDALEESDLSYICSRARSIKQAVIILKNIVPDIIFIDMSMPKTSSIPFLKKIKKMQCFKAAPVVMYSSIREQKADEAIISGASDYMLLPGNVLTMASILKNFFKGVKEISYADNIELSFYD
jgi:DNA-binding NtrC family response regulator